MKIKEKKNVTIKLSALASGDVFEYEDEVFLVSDEESCDNEELYMVVSVEGGEVRHFSDDDDVILLQDAFLMRGE